MSQIQPARISGTGSLALPANTSPVSPVSTALSPVTSGPSTQLQQGVQASREASQKLSALTGSEAVTALQGSLQGQSTQALQSRSAQLEADLMGSSLGRDLQAADQQLRGLQQAYTQGMSGVQDLQDTARLVQGEVTTGTLGAGMRSLQRLNQGSLGHSQLGSTLQGAERLLSQEKDLNQTLELLDGRVSAENLRSATRMTQTAAQIGGSDFIAKGTGKVLAPLNAICSGQASLKACQKLWDDPNPENLKAAASQSFQFLKDLKASLEMIPGGKVLTRALDKLITGLVPGAGLLELGDQALTMIGQIKLALDQPTALNISNAVLEVVKTTASAGKLVGGVVGFASSMAYTGAELAQTLINTDWKQVTSRVSTSVSQISASALSYLGGAGRWLGFA